MRYCLAFVLESKTKKESWRYEYRSPTPASDCPAGPNLAILNGINSVIRSHQLYLLIMPIKGKSSGKKVWFFGLCNNMSSDEKCKLPGGIAVKILFYRLFSGPYLVYYIGIYMN